VPCWREREDPEAFLRAMLAPLSEARSGGSLPGIPFSYEAAANACVMLGLLPEARAEEMLAGHRTELEARGFRFGVLTGELSVRSGAHGFQDARTAGREDLTEIPLAVTAGPVPLPLPGGGRTELSLTWARLTPEGAKLRFVGTVPANVSPLQPDRMSYRMVFTQDRGRCGRSQNRPPARPGRTRRPAGSSSAPTRAHPFGSI